MLTIRNLDDATKNALRLQAARHGISMEEEARRILRRTFETQIDEAPLGEQLLTAFSKARQIAAKEGLDEGLPLPARQRPRKPPTLG